MRTFISTNLLVLLLAGIVLSQSLSFTTAPSLTKDGGGVWWVDFAVSQNADVAVSIVRLKDSTVVRHLAGGMLGASAPAPLAAGTLSQHLQWDGKDDLGVTAANPESLSVRVRAGMSVALDKMTTPDPYQIYSPYSQVGGVSTDATGNVYVFGSTGMESTTSLRQFDIAGNYLKTIYPFPGTLTSAEVSGFGINAWESGSWYSPQTQGSSNTCLTSTLVGTKTNWLTGTALNGKVTLFNVGGWPTTFLNIQNILLSGAFGDQKALINTPNLPYQRGLPGEGFVGQAEGKDYVYLSGVYETVQDDFSQLLPTSPWKDGQVYRVNLATGRSSVWLTLADVPYDTATRHAVIGNLAGGRLSAVRGVAVDDSGRVFVCDRVHQRVAVYDTNATFLGSIAVKDPEIVAVNRYNGAVYVMTRWLDNTTYVVAHVSLVKFSGWRPGYTMVDSLQDFMTDVREAFGTNDRNRAFMALSQSAVKPVIWCAGGSNVWSVSDEGGTLKLQYDFVSRAQKWTPGYDRLAVDKRNETVYINDSWAGLYKIENWNQPTAIPCSTTTGQRIYATDMTISPKNLLYVREGNSFSGPVTRYSLARRHAPVPFANSNTNVLTSYIYSRMGAGYGEKGLAVRTDGHVAVAYMSGWCNYIVGLFGDSTGRSGDTASDTTKPWNNRIFSALPYPAANISGGFQTVCSPRYDLQDNLYIGINGVMPTGYTIPSGFAGDPAYTGSGQLGSVVKLPAGTFGARATPDFRVSVSAAKTYSLPLTPFTPRTTCMCLTPRFDVDGYGRLFVPNGYHNQVTVIDNAGTALATFGHYGNIDSWGPGSPVPEVDVALAMPITAVASEDYIYVSDMVNGRIVRMKMNYVLDNIPGLTSHSANIEGGRALPYALSIGAWPNPFTAGGVFITRLPQKSSILLEVYNVHGQKIRTLASGERTAGAYRFVWQGRDQNERPVAAGIYVCRLTAGSRSIVHRFVLAK